MTKTQTIQWKPFSDKHIKYIKNALKNKMNVAEGAIRSGKTIDHCIIAAAYLEDCPDKIHLASGSTIGNAKLNIGACNGFGLENLFRGRCKWGKFKDNEALYIYTRTGEKVVRFAGGAKADSYKRRLGNSYGLWIATEINEHYDCDDSRSSFIKVAFGRQVAAERPLVLWDLNPCNPRNKIYTDYIDKYRECYVGGYQYEHFTIADNLSITAQRRAEIESQYDKNSIWYQRDILGKRCIAEGIIYRLFNDDMSSKKRMLISAKPELSRLFIGVDFGGSGSAHTFVCTGSDRGYNNLYALLSERIACKNEKGQQIEIDPEKLGALFCDFVRRVIMMFGTPDVVYCDSAEQTLILGLKSSARKNGLGWLRIENALKTTINDRIRCAQRLMAQGRFYMLDTGCESLKDALCTAVWNPKETTSDVRLDDGTSDIDTLDAFEYTFERDITKFIKYE